MNLDLRESIDRVKTVRDLYHCFVTLRCRGSYIAASNRPLTSTIRGGPAIADHNATCPVNFSDKAHRRPAATGSIAWGKIFDTPGAPRVSPQSLGP
jgi:hypothetical protein